MKKFFSDQNGKNFLIESLAQTEKTQKIGQEAKKNGQETQFFTNFANFLFFIFAFDLFY